MPLAFSTVVRRVPHDEAGEVVLLDSAMKSVIARRPISPRDPDVLDLNPRGGARGGRGILRLDDNRLLAATYHSLHILDATDLRDLDRITGNLFVGIHEMCFDVSDAHHNAAGHETGRGEGKNPHPNPLPRGEGERRDSHQRIWIAATAIDAALCVDLDRQEIVESVWPREIPALKRLLSLHPLPIDKSADNRLRWLDTKHNDDPGHTHLNAVCLVDGEIHVHLNRFGLVWNAVRDRVVIHDPEMTGAHNLRFVDGLFAINDTRGRAVHFYDPATGRPARSIHLLDHAPIRAIHDAAQDAEPNARALFVRGMEVPPNDDEHILIGFSPASIAVFNHRTGALVDLYRYSTRVRECVHGLVWV